MKYTTVYALAIELALKADCPKPLNSVAGCWTRSFQHGGTNWCIAVNGHDMTATCEPPESMRCHVPAFNIAVWRNGWLAGTSGPYEGGVACDEQELLAAMRAEIECLPEPAHS